MEELKPCPFCGGEAKVMRDKCSGVYFIGCSNDKCLGFSALGWTYETAEEAIEAWNTRHESTCKLEKVHDWDDEWEPFGFVCGNCKEALPRYYGSDKFGNIITPNYCPDCGSKVVK